MPRITRRFFVALITSLLLVLTLSTVALADQRDFNINNNSDYVIGHA